MNLHLGELSDEVLNCNQVQYTRLGKVGLKTLKAYRRGKRLRLVTDDRYLQERINDLSHCSHSDRDQPSWKAGDSLNDRIISLS
jgi:hypothetical protein